jgi:hypothetical protein
MERRDCFLLLGPVAKTGQPRLQLETEQTDLNARPTPRDSMTSQAEVAEEISNCKRSEELYRVIEGCCGASATNYGDCQALSGSTERVALTTVCDSASSAEEFGVVPPAQKLDPTSCRMCPVHSTNAARTSSRYLKRLDSGNTAQGTSDMIEQALDHVRSDAKTSHAGGDGPAQVMQRELCDGRKRS